MIKDLFEKARRFSIGSPKESYTYDEVVRFLEDQKSGLEAYLTEPISTELEKLNSENKSITFNKKELEDKLAKLTKKNEEDIKTIESLNETIKPYKAKEAAEEATKLFKGKVVDGAENDVFKGLNKLEGFKDKFNELKSAGDETAINSFVDEQLKELLEVKPYFGVKEPEVEIKATGEVFASTEGEKENKDNEFVSSRTIIRSQEQ